MFGSVSTVIKQKNFNGQMKASGKSGMGEEITVKCLGQEMSHPRKLGEIVLDYKQESQIWFEIVTFCHEKFQFNSNAIEIDFEFIFSLIFKNKILRYR